MPRLLLIDDDEQLAELLVDFFQRFDLELVSAFTPSSGLQRLQHGDIDLIILDIMLPEMDGFEVCRRIRQNYSLPIIMLTARGDVMDRIVGLELGADDYLPKPFEPRELVARIHAILKRAGGGAENQLLSFGHLVLDTAAQQVRLDDTEISLSTMEYRLLELFAQNPGRTFSRDEILNQLKGVELEIYTRSVDILVSRLRQKLKPHNFIQTLRGMGYRFNSKAQ